MTEAESLEEVPPLAPAKLFDRLGQVGGYTWDRSVWLFQLIIPCRRLYERLTNLFATVSTVSFVLRPLVS